MNKSSEIPRPKRARTNSGANGALALAVKLHQQGDLQHAVAAYRRILKGQPDEPNALHLLGVTFQQSGNSSEALKWISKALTISPNNAVFHSNLASAYLSLGRLPQAEAHYRQALRLSPDFADAHNGLGAVLKGQGRFDEAISRYRKTLALKPGFVEAKSNLAHVLVEQDRAEEAVTVARDALRDDAKCVNAWVNLGHAQSVLGRTDDAVRSFGHALRLDRSNAAAYENLADLVLQGDYSFDHRTLITIKGLAADQGRAAPDRLRLNFALAKVLDRAGDYDQAFYHCSEGNRLRLRLIEQAGPGFIPKNHSLQMARIKAVFSREFLAQFGAGGVDSELPVFVIGMPRSGSTLIEQILCSHPKVFGAGERRDIGTLVDGLSTRQKAKFPELMEQLSPDRLLEPAGLYIARLGDLGGDAVRVIDKMLHNDIFLGLIYLMFPRARVIYCRRDPLDTCLSCFFQDFGYIQFACSLEHLAIFYLEQERLMAHWRETLPLQIHTVRYEELVADPEAESRKLIDFCGLEWSGQCMDFYKNRRAVKTASKLQVRRPVYNTSVQRWKRYRRHLGPLLQRFEPEEYSSK